jgi:hypothetical protein
MYSVETPGSLRSGARDEHLAMKVAQVVEYESYKSAPLTAGGSRGCAPAHHRSRRTESRSSAREAPRRG